MGNRNKKALTRSFLYSVELAWKFMAWWHLPRSRGTSITWAQSRALKTFFEFRWLTKTSPFRKKPRHWKNRQLRKKRTLQEDGFDWKKALNFFILLWCFLVNFYFLAKWTFFMQEILISIGFIFTLLSKNSFDFSLFEVPLSDLTHQKEGELRESVSREREGEEKEREEEVVCGRGREENKKECLYVWVSARGRDRV